MVSSSEVLATALLMPIASAFVGPQTTASRILESQRLFSAVPISPGDALVGALEREEKKVQKKKVIQNSSPAVVAKKDDESRSLSGNFLTGMLAINGALLGALVTFATLNPSPVVVDNAPPQTPAQIERTMQLKTQKLYEENLAAEQVSYMNGADFFFLN
jgi:hypothetical protein